VKRRPERGCGGRQVRQDIQHRLRGVLEARWFDSRRILDHLIWPIFEGQ
jgi:hypothetical protein